MFGIVSTATEAQLAMMTTAKNPLIHFADLLRGEGLLSVWNQKARKDRI